MKKFLLLLVAVVLAGGLVLSCSQPSSYEVTLTPGSAPEVDGTKIVATALTNTILVKWDGAEDSASYYVYRKEVGADGPIDGTLILRASGTGVSTSPKGVPYYFDTGIVNGKKYQYGIASTSYKSGSDVVLKSEVVWQEVENNAFVEAKVSAPGEVAITAPKYTIGKINSVAPTGTQTDYVENFLLTFEGLEPGITYNFRAEYENDNNATPTWYTAGTTSYTFGSQSAPGIGTYVDDGNKIVFNWTVPSGADNDASNNAYQYYGFQVTVSYALPNGSSGTVVLYPSDAGYYIKTSSPVAALDTSSSTTSVAP